MKKGISLVVLIITIIVMIILAGVVVLTGGNTISDAEKSKLQIDIVQLESLMDTYKLRKNGKIDFEIIEFNTTSLNSNELKQFTGENIVNNSIQLYVIDLYEIDAETVNYGNLSEGASDRYLYSSITGKVYYEKGLELDNMTYYYFENGER